MKESIKSCIKRMGEIGYSYLTDKTEGRIEKLSNNIDIINKILKWLNFKYIY